MAPVAMLPPVNSQRQAANIPMQQVQKKIICTASTADSLNGLNLSPMKIRITAPTTMAESSRAIQRIAISIDHTDMEGILIGVLQQIISQAAPGSEPGC